MLVIPLIETPNLILREHRCDDFPDFMRMWTDERVIRYTTRTAHSEQQLWGRLCAYRGHWSLLGFGYWAIEHRGSGRFVGELGFADFKRNIQPSLTGIPEMGWALDPSVHGRGYAREAVGAALEWGDARWPTRELACLIASENVRSVALAERFGFRFRCDTSYLGVQSRIFFRSPPMAPV